MKKKYSLLVFSFIVVNVIIPTGVSYNFVNPNSTSVWQVMQDDAQMFLYLEVNDTIIGSVLSYNDTTIQASLNSSRTFYRLEDEFIWTDIMCFPFFINPELLNPDLETQEITILDFTVEPVFGVDRQISLIRYNNIVNDLRSIVYYGKYDYLTGILISWEAINEVTGDTSSIILIETTAWQLNTAGPALWVWILLGCAGLFLTFVMVWWQITQRRYRKQLIFSKQGL